MPIPARLAKLIIRSGLVRLLPSVRRLVGDGLPYLKYFGSRTLESPNDEVKRMQELVAGAKDCLDLSLGVPPLLESLARTFVPAESHYPPMTGLPELRHAYAEKLASQNQMNVDPDNELFIANGVSQTIGLFLDAFLDAGERVAMFDPGYFMYRLAILHRRLRLVRLPFQINNGLAVMDESTLKAGLRGVRAILLNSPNNPAGAVFPPDFIERIAYWCRRYDVLIFADEVYEHFVYTGESVNIALLPDAHSRTISAFSFSKTYGMAGHRVGVAAGCRWLLQPMLVALAASTPFVPRASQRLAVAALNTPHWQIEARRLEFAKRRLWMADQLRSLGLEIEAPGGGFFCWAKIPNPHWRAGDLAAVLRDAAKVLIMPGESLAKNGTRYLRFSFAESHEVCVEAIRRLGPVLVALLAHDRERDRHSPFPIASIQVKSTRKRAA